MRLFQQLLLVLMLAGAQSATAGAWLQAPGAGLVINQATYYSTSSFFDDTGSKQPQARYRKFELQPYVEYGVGERLTIGGTAYVQRDQQSGRSNVGIADPEIFARTRLWSDDRQLFSVEPRIKLPSQFSKGGTPRGGSRSLDTELTLLYGRSLSIVSDRDYIDTQISYRRRSKGLGDQLRNDVAVGLSVTDTVQIIPAIRSVMAVNPKPEAIFSENGDLDYSLIKAEITGIYHLSAAQWLQIGVFKHVMGEQTGDGYGLSLGFAQRF